MKIELKNLTLTNFKGIRSATFDFDHITDLFGQNGTGKTTVMDGFLWLLFGKDSSDRKDFEIKTLDENNQHYHGLDHEVSGLMFVDSERLYIRRVYKEKWVTKRGESTPIFSGHETNYFWNDVPLKLEEYQAKISAIADESLFKLLTNTGNFNGLKWQDRRSVLMQIAGVIDRNEVLKTITTDANRVQIDEIMKALKENKTIQEFKSQIAAKKKKLKDELELIPARVNEANRALPEEHDYSALEKQLSEYKTQLAGIDTLLMNKTQAQKEHQQKISVKMKEVQGLMSRANEIEFEEKNKVQQGRLAREQVIADNKNNTRVKTAERDRLYLEYSNEAKAKLDLEKSAATLRAEWNTVNTEALVFNEDEFCCPACKRAYETPNVEAKKAELTANFNKSKSDRLKTITERGQKIAADLKVLEAKLSNIKGKGDILKVEITTLATSIAELEQENERLNLDELEQVKKAISGNTEYQGIQEMIRLANEQINTPLLQENNSELLSRKTSTNFLIDDINKQLATKEQRTKIEDRIVELRTQEKTMAGELASLDGIEYTIELFNKAEMDILESRVNGRFKYVRFKMFEEQINGGQAPACTTLIDGVPFADANTASKIRAGIDIINVLSEHYGVSAPIFIDNRESVIEIPETASQVINLIVSKDHEKLTVGSKSKSLAVA
jgi:exonuclease SbcC